MTIRRRIGIAAAVGAMVLGLAGCAGSTGPPSPTPADIRGIASLLRQHGIATSHFVSGDAGCPDRELARVAVSFDAVGLDQAQAARVHVYLFRNQEVYDRLRSVIDGCLPSFVTDPAALGLIEAPPYVAAGAGPWAPEFRAALREALTEAAGSS